MTHTPVLCKEVVSALSVDNGKMFVDATFGGGGHTSAILEKAMCSVVGIDRDPDALYRAKVLELKYNGRFSFIKGKFSDIATLLEDRGKFNGVLFDFGCSSFQLDSSERGFSFMNEGHLDMRMSLDGISAKDVLNTFSEEDIADIIYNYGEENKARRIASEIVKYRRSNIIDTTSVLRDIVASVYGFEFFHKRHSKIHVATKTFQAVRIFVNDELREIDIALNSIMGILSRGARIVTISFHALEDRTVKMWQRKNSDFIKNLSNGVIKPSIEEIKSNPRSRSAVLRVFSYE